MSTPIGADVVVEVVLKYDRAEWPRLTAELCGGDAGLEALVARLLAHYDRPDAPLPAGPYPVELGPFILERELGAGAHGKVYLARRPPLEGYVAVKLLRPGPGMSEFVEQVRREAGRARRIPSVHVVPVFDAGRIDGGPFYVEMAVCADPDEEAPGSIRIGRSLAEAQVGLGPAEAARLVEDLARAVHAAHRTGVVHGDVKPENVLLTPESRRVMLADFGIATSLAASSSPGSTPIGTVAYMAPEQWRDHLPPSEASDVYTLGGTLYFLLSGLARLALPPRQLLPRQGGLLAGGPQRLLQPRQLLEPPLDAPQLLLLGGGLALHAGGLLLQPLPGPLQAVDLAAQRRLARRQLDHPAGEDVVGGQRQGGDDRQRRRQGEELAGVAPREEQRLAAGRAPVVPGGLEGAVAAQLLGQRAGRGRAVLRPRGQGRDHAVEEA